MDKQRKHWLSHPFKYKWELLGLILRILLLLPFFIGALIATHQLLSCSYPTELTTAVIQTETVKREGHMVYFYTADACYYVPYSGLTNPDMLLSSNPQIFYIQYDPSANLYGIQDQDQNTILTVDLAYQVWREKLTTDTLLCWTVFTIAFGFSLCLIIFNNHADKFPFWGNLFRLYKDYDHSPPENKHLQELQKEIRQRNNVNNKKHSR